MNYNVFTIMEQYFFLVKPNYMTSSKKMLVSDCNADNAHMWHDYTHQGCMPITC
jgi:hypothetical protein